MQGGGLRGVAEALPYALRPSTLIGALYRPQHVRRISCWPPAPLLGPRYTRGLYRVLLSQRGCATATTCLSSGLRFLSGCCLAGPEQAHRLDLATGGLLMVGKTRPALQALCNAFAQREARAQPPLLARCVAQLDTHASAARVSGHSLGAPISAASDEGCWCIDCPPFIRHDRQERDHRAVK